MSLFPKLYDALAPAEHGRLGRWRQSVVGAARGRVLEIGAGTGLNFAHYRTRTWVIATDPDLEMLAQARARTGSAATSILLVVADAEALPFRDESFDEGVGLALCTIPHPEQALDELRRAICPGGTLRLLRARPDGTSARCAPAGLAHAPVASRGGWLPAQSPDG